MQSPSIRTSNVVKVLGVAVHTRIKKVHLIMPQSKRQGSSVRYLEIEGHESDYVYVLNEAKERVESMWRSLGRNPRIVEICNLQITPMGREKGEELLITRSDIRMNSSGRHPMVKIPNRQIAVFQELLQKYNPKLLPRLSSSGYFDIEAEEVDSIQHFVCNEMVAFGKNEDEFNQYGHDMEELIDAIGRPFM